MKVELHFGDRAAHEQLLSTMKPGQHLLSVAMTQTVDLSIIFGLRSEDRQFFTAHQCELIEHLHAGYIKGEWRPKTGSGADFITNIIEKIAGGIPSPSDREELTKQAMLHCLEIVKRPASTWRPRLVGGVEDQKRDKLFDDIARIQAEARQ